MYNNLFSTTQALNGVRGRQEGVHNTKKQPDPVSFREGRGGATPVLHPEAGPLQRAVEEASHGHGIRIRNPLESRNERQKPRDVLHRNVPETISREERLRLMRKNFLSYMNGERYGE